MKIKTTLIVAFLIIGMVGITGYAIADNSQNSPGSEDNITSYGELDAPNGPGYGPGPAPNSGDGIPDGPGW